MDGQGAWGAALQVIEIDFLRSLLTPESVLDFLSLLLLFLTCPFSVIQTL
jgi:hypothetical protein